MIALRVLFALVLAAGLARADESDDTAEEDAEIAERMQFLREHVHSEAIQARAWLAGWSVVYSVGLGYGAYQIGTADDSAGRAAGITGVVKSAVGATSAVFRPLSVARGLHPIERLPEATIEDRRLRLALAEELLRRYAKESDRRYSWQPRLISIALSIAGGAIIWGFGDFWKGLQSAGLGIAVGEIRIWTQPWSPKRHLREYERRFGGFGGEYPISAARTLPPPGPTVVRVGATGFGVEF